MKVGKFYIANEAVHEEDFYKILNIMKFVPLRVEFIGYKGAYEYIGLSPLFEKKNVASELIEYKVIAHRDDSDPINPVFSVEVEKDCKK